MPRASLIKMDDLKVNSKMIEVAQNIVVHGNITKAAMDVGVSYHTIQLWFRENEDFNKLIQKFSDALIAELKLEMVVSAKDALRVAKEIMNDKMVDAKERLKAAQDILNRTPGLGAKDQKQVDITTTVNYFAKMADDELDKIIDLEIEDVSYEPCEKGTDSIGEDGEAETGSV